MGGIVPKIKREIESFILDERGGASKQALVSLGAMFAGIEALALFSKFVSGQTISVKHDHADPGHASGGWGAHSSADGVPASHSSSHGSAGWGSSGGNAAHLNYVYISYG
jgi:hypothetical protein